MTNEQKKKITELKKLGIGYRSIATAMGLSRDSVRSFCKSRRLDGYGQDYSRPKPEKVIREHCKNCGKPINQKKLKGHPKTYCSTECKRDWEHKNPIIYHHVCIIVEQSLRTNQRMEITVVVDVTFEIGSGEMKR